MAESIYAKICYQSNNKYINDPNLNQCDLIVDYHGVTEFGDQKLNDEAFLVRLEWSD